MLMGHGGDLLIAAITPGGLLQRLLQFPSGGSITSRGRVFLSSSGRIYGRRLPTCLRAFVPSA